MFAARRIHPSRQTAGGIMLALAIAAAGIPSEAFAGDHPTASMERATRFDIRPQPLEPALVAFSLASGISVLVNSAMVSGKTTAGVKGSFAPREALQRLLRGTGLSPRYSQASSVTLEPVGDARAATMSSR